MTTWSLEVEYFDEEWESIMRRDWHGLTSPEVSTLAAGIITKTLAMMEQKHKEEAMFKPLRYLTLEVSRA